MQQLEYGVIFVGTSYPITSKHFKQTDGTHWVIDATSMVSRNIQDLKEVVLFIASPQSLPQQAALSLYVQIADSGWQFIGYVSHQRPSHVMPVRIPGVDGMSIVGNPNLSMLLGVTIEPLDEASRKITHDTQPREAFARAVAIDFFRFLQSFNSQLANEMQALIDKWYNKFVQKFRYDPDFLTRQQQSDGL